MGLLKNIANRIYADYFMSSRINEYKSILKLALDKGYEFVTLAEYQELLRNNKLKKDQKYFINRHDIDTGLSFTKEFFRVEQEFGLKASYYFRLSTLDLKMMQEIEASGSEASYHFEEIATYAKKHKLKKKEEVLDHLTEIRSEFKKNFVAIKTATGNKMSTVASHGDFANRLLGMTNSIIIDEALREELKIDAETYDQDLLDACEVYISDDDYPRHFKPLKPQEALENEPQVIQMLTHPRHWKRDLISNTKENITRIMEGFRYGN